jgi:CHAT domain-containing protein
MLGRDATEAAFKARTLADFRIIHIVAHGIASDRFPDRAALVLGSDPKSGEDLLLPGVAAHILGADPTSIALVMRFSYNYSCHNLSQWLYWTLPR